MDVDEGEDANNGQSDAEILEDLNRVDLLEDYLGKIKDIASKLPSDYYDTVNQSLLVSTLVVLEDIVLKKDDDASNSRNMIRLLAQRVEDAAREVSDVKASVKSIKDAQHKDSLLSILSHPPSHSTPTPNPVPTPNHTQNKPGKASYAQKANEAKSKHAAPTPPKAATKPATKPNLINAPNHQAVLVLKEKRGRITVDFKSIVALNATLKSAGAKAEILAISQSLAGNLILNTREDDKADELIAYRDIIVNHLFPNPSAPIISKMQVRCDYFEFKINYCPLVNPFNNEPFTAAETWKTIQDNDRSLRSTPLLVPPRWLKEPQEGAHKGTIVATVGSQDTLDRILATKETCAYGSVVKFSPYVKRRTVRYCGHCGSMNHLTWKCTKHSCTKCTSTEHTEEGHPNDVTEKCINCKGPHHATYSKCPLRLARTDRTSKPNKPKPPKPTLPTPDHKG